MWGRPEAVPAGRQGLQLRMTARRRIGRLPDMVAALAPPADRELFDRLFRASVSEGRLRAPESMRGWLEDRFGSAKAVERQTVVRVTNRWTLEEAVFNPLRAHRLKALATGPPPPGGGPPSGRVGQAPREQGAEAVYPLLFWNCGAAAGASLSHAHLQVALARSRHFGAAERLRAAAEEDRARHGAGHFPR